MIKNPYGSLGSRQFLYVMNERAAFTSKLNTSFINQLRKNCKHWHTYAPQKEVRYYSSINLILLTLLGKNGDLYTENA